MSLDIAFKHNWHPCSQMKDYEQFPYLHIKSAKGSVLTLKNGHQVIDAISSWWCKSLGHGHTELKEALEDQVAKFEHVIFANTTSDLAIQFGEKITGLTKNLDKCFYAGDGSTAIEVALKLSLQYHQQTGGCDKYKFAYLKNSYHGESIFCYSTSDLDLYKNKFKPILSNFTKNLKISDFHYLSGELSENNFPVEDNWLSIKKNLDKHKENLAGIIIEPIVQGAGGMLIYSADLLVKLRSWCSQNDVHLIADEIMTGLGRVGNTFACEYAGIEPDIMCLMKGLSAGWLPFSAILTTSSIYDAFYDDYASGKAFMHSNTFTGHPLGMAIASKALDIYQRENFFEVNKKRGLLLSKILKLVGEQTGALAHVRQIGMIAAADLVNSKNGQFFDPKLRMGHLIYQKAIEFGILIRPLGDTLYLLPPYNITDEELAIIETSLLKTIKHCIT